MSSGELRRKASPKYIFGSRSSTLLLPSLLVIDPHPHQVLRLPSRCQPSSVSVIFCCITSNPKPGTINNNHCLCSQTAGWDPASWAGLFYPTCGWLGSLMWLHSHSSWVKIYRGVSLTGMALGWDTWQLETSPFLSPGGPHPMTDGGSFPVSPPPHSVVLNKTQGPPSTWESVSTTPQSRDHVG